MELIEEIHIPKIEEIDYSGLPDLEIVKQTVRELLKGFLEIPEEERNQVLIEKMQDKEKFVKVVWSAMVSDLIKLSAKTLEDHFLPDVDWTALQVVDFVFNILKPETDITIDDKQIKPKKWVIASIFSRFKK